MNVSTGHAPFLSVRRSMGLVIGIVLLHRLLMVWTENNLELRAGLNDLFNLVVGLDVAIGMFYVANRFEKIQRINCMDSVGRWNIVKHTRDSDLYNP